MQPKINNFFSSNCRLSLLRKKQPLHKYGGEVYLHRPHNPRAAQAWTKAWGKGHMRMHEWAGYRNPGRAPTEPCGLLWGNEQSLEHMLKGRLDYPRTPREIRDSPALTLGNEDGEALGRKRIESPENTKSLPSVIRQPCLLGPGCVQRKTDFFGVCRGAEKPAAPKDGTRPRRR